MIQRANSSTTLFIKLLGNQNPAVVVAGIYRANIDLGTLIHLDTGTSATSVLNNIVSFQDKIDNRERIIIRLFILSNNMDGRMASLSSSERNTAILKGYGTMIT